ncbi:Spherulin-1A [Drechslerella dactyloides]|uniref:Spherulin-1A n=1 Tax=Drechslerella dactyloides TaxID=74499 RepID=A0AAD6J2N1_DREDA|nr:Spherulin-1A [Drechslerella dactyloides]
MFFRASTVAILATVASTVFAAPAPNRVEKRQTPTTGGGGEGEIGVEPSPTYTSAYSNFDLIAKLVTAPLQADRIALLRDEDFVFDFRNPPGNVQVATGNAGRVVPANRKTFPALIGTGSGMAMGFLGPCGFNTPHTHPRGTELNVVVVGSLVSSIILENGARVINSNFTTFQMHVFPQGAIHQEFNPDCGETIFVAGFNNEDFGTSQVADNFFRLPTDVVTAAVGGNIVVDGRDVDQFRSLIPKNVAIGVESCLKKCGLAKR